MLTCLAFTLLVAAANPPPVGVDVTAVGEEAFKTMRVVSLKRKLVVRLADEGFAVVNADSGPSLVVSLSSDSARSLSVTVETPAWSRTRRLSLGPGQRVEILHLEVIHHVLALLREVTVAGPAPDLEPEERVTTSTEPPDTEPWIVSLEAGGGAIWRGDAFDPSAAMAARIGQAAGGALQLWVEAGHRGRAHLRTTDIVSAVGPAWRWEPVAAAMSPEVGLLLGVVHRLYSFTYSQGRRRGYEADAVLGGRFGLRWSLTSRIAVSAHVSPWWTGRKRIYQRGDREIWSASALFISGGITLGVRAW